MLTYDDLINRYVENRCKHNEIVKRRHCGSALPLVNGLRRRKSENVLYILDGEPGTLAHLLQRRFRICGIT